MTPFRLNWQLALLRIIDLARRIEGRKLVVVAGPTCSGKSTLARILYREFAQIGLASSILQLDKYFLDHDDPNLPIDGEGHCLFDVPGSFHRREFISHVIELMSGHNIVSPEYSKKENRRLTRPDSGLLVVANQIIIAEGLFTLEFLRRLNPTIAVYVDVPVELSLDRRIARDMEKFKIPREKVVRFFNLRIAPYLRRVTCQRAFANILVDNSEEVNFGL